MAVQARRAKPPRKSTSISNVRYCNLPPRPAPVLPPGMDLGRARAIIVGRSMWVNGTVLHYYFFDRDTDGSTVRFSDGTTQFVPWVGAAAQQDAVRKRLRGVEGARHRARVRRGRRPRARRRSGSGSADDGSWSYVGRDVLGISDERADDELRLGPHRRLRAHHRAARDRPHARHAARAPEPVRRHRVGRGGGLHVLRRGAQQLGPRQHLPQRASQARRTARSRGRRGIPTRSWSTGSPTG